MPGEERDHTAWQAWRQVPGGCCAYWEDGRVYREPASIVNHQRGGLVCAAHATAATVDADPTGERAF